MDVAQFRREREELRSQMERIVRQMQDLEGDIDAKRPGHEGKRSQLTDLRAELAELRQRMKRTMEHQNAVQAASLSSSAASTPMMSERKQRSGAPPTQQMMMHPLSSPAAHAQPPSSNSVQRDRVSPTRAYPRNTTWPEQQQRSSSSQPRYISPIARESFQSTAAPTQSQPFVQQQQSMMVDDMRYTPRGELLMQQMKQRHLAEVDALREEFSRLSEVMQQRHAGEFRALQDTLREELIQLRDYQEAKEKMERAQRQLQALQAMKPTTASYSSGGVPPEVDALRGRMNSAGGR